MDRLVGVWSHNRGEAETKGLVSPADFLDWSARARSFDAIAAWRGASFNVERRRRAGRARRRSCVTPGVLSALRLAPVIGPRLHGRGATAGRAARRVLSHAFWQNMLGGRPDIVGQTVQARRRAGDDRRRAAAHAGGPTAFFVPLSLADAARRSQQRARCSSLARLRPRRRRSTARAPRWHGIGAALEREFPATNRGWTVNTRPLQEEFVGPQARLVFALLVGMVCHVLLIGCVNIANLLLARGVARRGELAVRLALGAGGWRVVRQLLVECALLAVLGGAAVARRSRAGPFNLLTSLGAVDSPWVANGGPEPARARW